MACRVPLNKQERKQLKTAHRGGMAGGALLDDFADEIGHLVQVSTACPDGIMTTAAAETS